MKPLMSIKQLYRWEIQIYPAFLKEKSDTLAFNDFVTNNGRKSRQLQYEETPIITHYNQHQFAPETDADGQTFIVGAQYNIGGKFLEICTPYSLISLN